PTRPARPFHRPLGRVLRGDVGLARRPPVGSRVAAVRGTVGLVRPRRARGRAGLGVARAGSASRRRGLVPLRRAGAGRRGRPRGPWRRHRRLVGAPARAVSARRRGAVWLGEGAGRRQRAGLVVRRRPGRSDLVVSSEIAAAYSQIAGAWQRGPAVVYDRLAEVI